MADLSDLDTSSISICAFYNAISQGGASDIDPSNVTSYSEVSSSTLYDNGIEGTITGQGQKDVSFRVKEDGWVIVWFDRQQTFNQEETNAADVVVVAELMDYQSGDTATFPDTQFEDHIRGLVNQLSGVSFNDSDIQYHDFEYPDATTFSLWGHQRRSSSSTNQGEESIGFTRGTGTTPFRLMYAARAFGDSNESGSTYLDDPGVYIVRATSSTTEYGAYDLVANGDVPAEGEKFNVTTAAYSDTSEGEADTTMFSTWA